MVTLKMDQVLKSMTMKTNLMKRTMRLMRMRKIWILMKETECRLMMASLRSKIQD